MQLPDAEFLLAELVERIRPTLSPRTGLVGIHTGGVWVAERLHRALGVAVPLGTIDVAFYRDDYGRRGLKPDVRPSDLPFDVAEHDIILVDDVLYTGRTVRAALNALFDYGRPGRVTLAALVDRGGRQLPICPQFVGGTLEVEGDGRVVVLRRSPDGVLSLGMEDKRATA